jgi:hypothetical protein
MPATEQVIEESEGTKSAAKEKSSANQSEFTQKDENDFEPELRNELIR